MTSRFRHRWVKIDADMRRYVDERRRHLHRCATCRLWRVVDARERRTHYDDGKRQYLHAPLCQAMEKAS